MRPVVDAATYSGSDSAIDDGEFPVILIINLHPSHAHERALERSGYIHRGLVAKCVKIFLYVEYLTRGVGLLAVHVAVIL